MNQVKEPIGKIALDMPDGRYNLVALAKDWMNILKNTEEVKGLGQSELVKKALDDIVSGRVTKEDVYRAQSKLKNSPVKEEEKEKKLVHAGEKMAKHEKAKK
jgi:hypothetical protein